MIQLENTLISNDLQAICFACDLAKCKGACCVEGDAGAPLEEEEISLLEDYIDEIIVFMLPAGIEEIASKGVFDYDADGKYVTPLVNGKTHNSFLPILNRNSIPSRIICSAAYKILYL